MGIFNFELRPVHAITPWGGESPTLSWFGLSDGWYWLELGGQEIFRARAVEPGEPPYADYQVVRLWEDVLELFPAVLEEGGAGCYLWSAHFVAAPRVRIWPERGAVCFQWESDPAGTDLWEPVEGTTSFSVERFLAETRAFDRAFMAAMGERVEAVVQNGGIPGLSMDLDWLQHEQRDRATWLESRMKLT